MKTKENHFGVRVPQLTVVAQWRHLVVIPATVPRAVRGPCPALAQMLHSRCLSLSKHCRRGPDKTEHPLD